jgi:hypothetical protein
MIRSAHTLVRPLGAVFLGAVLAMAAVPATATMATASSHHSAATVKHMCGLLSNRDIKHLLGTTPFSSTPSGGVDKGDRQCTWELNSLSGSLSITYEPSIKKSDLTQFNGELGSDAKRVSGVGTVAYISCSPQQGQVPAQCQLRAYAKTKTMSFVLSSSASEVTITSEVATVAKMVYSEL